VPDVLAPAARSRLDRPLRDEVGGRAASALAKNLGLHTVGELLRHYPRRYVQRGELTDLASLRVDEDATVLAQVQSASLRPMRSRKGMRLEVVVTDGTGRLVLTFFHAVKHHERALVVGRRGLFTGKVGRYGGTWQLAHPEYEMLRGDDGEGTSIVAGELIPIYPVGGTLRTWDVAQSAPARHPRRG
jgi:ATP-dependent DNA helicase RecG